MTDSSWKTKKSNIPHTFVIKGATLDDFRKPTIKDPIICECGKKLISMGTFTRHMRKCEKTKDVANVLDRIVKNNEPGHFQLTSSVLGMDITKSDEKEDFEK